MSVELQALLFAQAHDNWRRLRAQRAAFRCDHEHAEIDGALSLSHGRPCWKWNHGEITYDGEGRERWDVSPGYEREEAEWCDSCRERVKVNAAVHRAAKSRNSLLGALLRASRKALK